MAKEIPFKTEHPEDVRLYPFIQKKNPRQFEIVEIKARQREILRGVPLEITKFGEASYKLVSKSPLGPGEYAIDMAGKIFTFGID